MKFYWRINLFELNRDICHDSSLKIYVQVHYRRDYNSIILNYYPSFLYHKLYINLSFMLKMVGEYTINPNQKQRSDKISEQYTATHQYGFQCSCKVINKARIGSHIQYARKNAMISLNQETLQIAIFQHYNVLKGICNENVQEVKGILQTINNIYIFYEMYSQKSLSKLVREKEMSLPEIISYSLQIAQGALCLHQHCIIHGNICLQSILIDENNQIKLSDFSLTHIPYEYEAIKDYRKLQTVYYPPQFHEYSGPQSDVWNCGIVIYQMIFKKPPMEYFQYVRKRSTAENFKIRFDSKIMISKQVKRLIDSMLQFNYKLRPTMKEIIQILQKEKQLI